MWEQLKGRTQFIQNNKSDDEGEGKGGGRGKEEAKRGGRDGWQTRPTAYTQYNNGGPGIAQIPKLWLFELW